MLNAKSEVDNMIVRVGFLDKDENYIARLANYYSAHALELGALPWSRITSCKRLRASWYDDAYK